MSSAKEIKKQTSHLFTWIIPQVGFRTDKLISSPSTSFQHLPTIYQHQKCRQQELWHQPKLHALLFGAIPLIYHRFASSLIPPHNWVALNDPCFSGAKERVPFLVHGVIQGCMCEGQRLGVLFWEGMDPKNPWVFHGFVGGHPGYGILGHTSFGWFLMGI